MDWETEIALQSSHNSRHCQFDDFVAMDKLI